MVKEEGPLAYSGEVVTECQTSICMAQTPNLVTLWASISSVLFVQFN